MLKSRLKKIVALVVLFGIISFALITVISYSIVKQFIYRRVHKLEWLNQTRHFNERLYSELGAQRIMFQTSHGMTLVGLLFVRPHAKRNVLMCHGYSRSKERLFNLITLFPEDNIFIFDYRAHGESQGDYTTIGFYETDDVQAAFNVLKLHEQTQHLPIFGIGVSMGAVSLLGCAAQGTAFKGIVVDSPFKQLEEQVARIFPAKTGLPLMPFMTFCHSIFEYLCQCSMHDVDALRWAKNLKVPIFIIHSNHDTMAHVEAAHQLYAAVPGHKKLWIVDNAIHARIYKLYPQDYVQKVNLFFNSIL